jgi:potassium efflux system protein
MNKSRLISAIFCIAALTYAQEKNAPAEPNQDNSGRPAFINVTEITGQADGATSRINQLKARLESQTKASSIEKQLPATLDSLKKMHSADTQEPLAKYDLRILTSMSQKWELLNKKLSEWNNSLFGQSQSVEQIGKTLADMETLWKATGENALREKAPKAILHRVSALQEEIKSAESIAGKSLNQLLLAQNSISETQTWIRELLGNIKSVENARRGQLFVRDSPPLWESLFAARDSVAIVNQFRSSWSELIQENVAFVKLNIDRVYLHIAILILITVLMGYLDLKNRKQQLFDEDDAALKDSAYFISRPYSAALMVTLFLSVWIYPERNSAVGEVILLLLLIPVLRMSPGILQPELTRPVMALGALYILDVLQTNAMGFVRAQRLSLLLASLAGLSILIWLIMKSRTFDKRNLRFLPALFWRSLYLVLIFMFISLLANVYGITNLADLLCWGVIESVYLFVIIYLFTMITTGIVTVLIRRRRVKAMQFIKTYAQNVERWAKMVINFTAMIIWIRISLKIFGILDPIKSWYQEVIAIQWKIGSMVISVNAVVDMILILLGTFVITKVIRIFLDLEIFPRLRLPKGLPGAISMMIRYILVTFGLFMAISSIGIDLGAFGLLAGALGVGLGFGLQKIVANFISSLILGFGQVIRIGDTISYNEAIGNVTDIGVNTTVVKTFDGSDVIIPNSDLISNKVINWTLSDTIRRMELPVKVAFENDPHHVLKILQKVVQDHPDVLKKPEPIAVFNGFGDNFLDFTLYYWIQSGLFFRLKTEVALNVYDEMKAHGIKTPRPQRDLRLSMDDKEGDSGASTGKSQKKKPGLATEKIKPPAKNK